jgi:hypothetical protein
LGQAVAEGREAGRHEGLLGVEADARASQRDGYVMLLDIGLVAGGIAIGIFLVWLRIVTTKTYF